MRLLFIINLFIVLVLSGCSNKKQFEPEKTHGNYKNVIEQMPEYVKDINKDGATLNDNSLISKDGISKYKLPDEFTFINKVGKVVIAANNNAQILLKNKSNIIDMEKNVVSASLRDKFLSIVFADNTIALYDISTNKFKMKEQLKASMVNDTRTANPVFLDDIILYPTLDGKIVVVGIDNGATIKTMNIDPDGDINNVIFLETIGNTMVAATTNKIVSLTDGSFNVKDFTIKDVAIKDKNIYVATLDGKILKLDLLLNTIAKKKFKFAKIHALVATNSLFALESQGYLIQLNHNLTQVKVYEMDFDNKNKTIAVGNTLYFDDKYIKLDK